ncbi:MAG: Crp/Fnr family transcriptional regulator [Nitrospiraceae bacterium]|nr:Crp/Fnr family transcriptional regulator [Nitrospiraceae bacterium]
MLEKIGIFSALSRQEAESVEPFFKRERRRRKDVIFSEGDPSDWFYIVLEGKVKITKLSQEGKEIILEVIGPGEVFGGIAAIRGLPYPANALVMEDCLLLKTSRQDLLGIMGRFPAVTMAVFQDLGGRLQHSHESMKLIALEKVLARVASLLVNLAGKSGRQTPEGPFIELKLTKQEIAEMVGTTVETSIRTMSRLKKDGVIAEKNGGILIKDIERLKQLM